MHLWWKSNWFDLTSYCLPQCLMFECTWTWWDVGLFSQTMEFNSNIKKLVMMVEVTNTPDGDRQAEDAHQAVLNITIPPSLKYSAVRFQVRPDRDALSPFIFISPQINCAWLSCKRASFEIKSPVLYNCFFDLGFILLYHFKCILFISKIFHKILLYYMIVYYITA